MVQSNRMKPRARVPSYVTQSTHPVLRTPNKGKGKGRVVKAILPRALLRCQPSSGAFVTFEKVQRSDVLGAVSLAAGCGRCVRDAEKDEDSGCGSRPVNPSERAWPTAYACQLGFCKLRRPTPVSTTKENEGKCKYGVAILAASPVQPQCSVSPGC